MKMLSEQFAEINKKLDQILALHRSLPTWYPVNNEFAKECGYKTTEGLQKWCYNNLPPSDFVKKGKGWYIHVKSLPHVKMRGKTPKVV